MNSYITADYQDLIRNFDSIQQESGDLIILFGIKDLLLKLKGAFGVRQMVVNPDTSTGLAPLKIWRNTTMPLSMVGEYLKSNPVIY